MCDDERRDGLLARRLQLCVTTLGPQRGHIGADRERGAEPPVGKICRKAGISQATYFNWKKKYAGMMPSEIARWRKGKGGRAPRISTG